MNTRDSKEILDLITTLTEANDYLDSSEEISFELLAQVITNCLTASDNISQTLQTFGELDQYQAELAAYQRLLKDFLAAISQAGELAYPAQAITECLAKMIAKLKAKHKKRVVFLPYKASMWDSLASIYEAALADPNCEPYVIPLPYFSKDQNGKLEEFHYEADLFPPEVKITSWQDYPLAQKRPDVIYIHNPYDDENLVTTVLPAFYSDKLKQYTGLLVYVPYYVSLHERNFYSDVFTKGLENIDLVCVQDDVIKAGYQEVCLKEWNKFLKKNPNHPKAAYERTLNKFVTLGNPKYDALNKVKPINYPLPNDWRKKLYRPDGSKKTVVFYNTTILDLNLGGQTMFRKYADVFDFFWNHREDYALIWRPHPLLADNIRVKYPNFLSGYLQLIDQFNESQMGIYDDSPDFYLAYTYADAFYGDISSMAELFRRLGKPVIQQKTTYETSQVPANFDFNLAKKHLAKQEVIREYELPLAKIPAFLTTLADNQQTVTDYHFGLDIHRYVMNLVN